MSTFKKIVNFASLPFIGGFTLAILFPEIHILKIIIVVVGLELFIEFKMNSLIKNSDIKNNDI
ncbi:MAG: hypothetical protein RSD06_03030 [Bacilli bacterium]